MSWEEHLVQKAKEQNILILGLGVEGQAAVRFFGERGARLTVYDQNSLDTWPTAVAKMLEQVGARFTNQLTVSEENFTAVIRSPGFLPHQPICARLLARGIPLTTGTNLFLLNTPAQVIGVTGTKGKGTTSTLIAQFLQAAGKKVFLGGNIGTAALELLPQCTTDSWAVLELASFQLIDAVASPRLAVILMVTSDHLDQHRHREEYLLAKQNITAWQKPDDQVVFNLDYVDSRPRATAAGQYGVSTRGAAGAVCYVADGQVWLNLTEKVAVIPTADILLPGEHNWENVCAAVAAAALVGVPISVLRAVLGTFPGLEHRLELVRTHQEVRYYNDSFATTPESTLAAVRAFTAPAVLILGGSGKGSDFSSLAEALAKKENLRALVGIGSEWPRLKDFLLAAGVKAKMIEGLTTMPEIVAAASQCAQPGDVVLLSPACASFGLFTNYKERGLLFKKAVNEL